MTSKIPEQFIPRPRSMLESEAYRSLSLSARRVMERIELEHLKHGGKDNGKLPVTRRDFSGYGIREASVSSGLCEAITKGFVRITRKGRSGKHGSPTEYRLTYIHAHNRPPTNEWKRYPSISAETAPIGVPKRHQLGAKPQQKGSAESSPNKGAESSPLSREVSSTTTHCAADCASPPACTHCHVADDQVHLAAGRWYPRGGLWLHRACRQSWLNENRDGYGRGAQGCGGQEGCGSRGCLGNQ